MHEKTERFYDMYFDHENIKRWLNLNHLIVVSTTSLDAASIYSLAVKERAKQEQ